MEFGQVRQRHLSDDIAAQLEAMILEGTLKSGEQLPAERVLAGRFGVSRPSLREAIRKLVAKGLLVSRQDGGDYVAELLGATLSDPPSYLLEDNPEAQRDLLKFCHTLEGSCAYYAALHAASLDHQYLTETFEALQACCTCNDQVSAEEGVTDARFHLAIVRANHNTVLLHTIKDLLDLLRCSVVTNIGGMYVQRTETYAQLTGQRQRLYGVIISGQAELAREVLDQYTHYVQEVLAEAQERTRRMKHSQRRRSVQED